MRILGLGGSHHDFGACLVEDGRVVSAVEEERLVRKKIAFGLGPRLQQCRAGDYVLAEGGLGPQDVDLIVANDFVNPVYTLRHRDRIEWIGHHLSHAASTFYTSPFQEAAVLVMDGRGSTVERDGEQHGETVTFYRGDADGLTPVRSLTGRVATAEHRLDDTYENSIGWMYEAVSKEIGFRTVGGMGAPGKTMGLAPYGTPRHVEALAALYDLHDGTFRQSLAQQDAVRALVAGELAKAADEEAADAVRADFAYAVQANTERIVVELARWLHRETGATDLCLAGGVALNSVANYLILRDTPFERLHIVPAAGDGGTAIGAALYGHHVLGGHPWAPSPELFSPYLGRLHTEAEIEAAVAAQGGRLRVERPDDLYATVARELADGAVVGWFQGRSEIGPRALGNRSILADPRDPGMKDRINAKVKHREAFRPFAPVVLEDRQTEYFDTAVPAHYMLLVPQVREDRRADIPSVTHIDGSARLQTATPALNPELCALITAFDRITGVPVLLNTSFNDNEEPIVESPEDAVRCFLTTELDVLVLHGLVVRKADGT
ncbi:carbamoyltransferase C-terminal domain-containing protein [Streptomyces sp. BE20]|uniref:carbamoyltransferase family protein n=1 Tax=Streptomyces sp. BE20 TaxID=3002525 RepID=UPI002E77234E|nr:carbamoyltransferase C-terminal domain-containing protein [Streptomyces sp. BE20]MEE1822815.1 carbamoyltransferase C-terminal domain-containing protein [Streptomyces sp. BE20]